jgi:hypothetical protein
MRSAGSAETPSESFSLFERLGSTGAAPVAFSSASLALAEGFLTRLGRDGAGSESFILFERVGSWASLRAFLAGGGAEGAAAVPDSAFLLGGRPGRLGAEAAGAESFETSERLGTEALVVAVAERSLRGRPRPRLGAEETGAESFKPFERLGGTDLVAGPLLLLRAERRKGGGATLNEEEVILM